ncbi:hypothetical protein RESH_00138 [Rhodopirellula europaea SH398]|uniref:Uncharacterized protein n=2 Tax=Rhodopirellula europaea TaxID=1263866 RepID=M2B5X3_9BACT|nr:hypothetical protein RE6C_01670 [Rhodopirellula europaea 6C]EMI29289.1 hypothetical protein RESH_00138 [Rhodopirellula europaea SH398]
MLTERDGPARKLPSEFELGFNETAKRKKDFASTPISPKKIT